MLSAFLGDSISHRLRCWALRRQPHQLELPTGGHSVADLTLQEVIHPAGCRSGVWWPPPSSPWPASFGLQGEVFLTTECLTDEQTETQRDGALAGKAGPEPAATGTFSSPWHLTALRFCFLAL